MSHAINILQASQKVNQTLKWNNVFKLNKNKLLRDAMFNLYSLDQSRDIRITNKVKLQIIRENHQIR